MSGGGTKTNKYLWIAWGVAELLQESSNQSSNHVVK